MRIEIEYYAVLREQAGCNRESLTTDVLDAAALYRNLRKRHGFELEQQRLRVAINDTFSDWSQRLADGDRVVFIPPVAGG